MKTWQAIEKIGVLVTKSVRNPSKAKRLFQQVDSDVGVLDVTKARMQDAIDSMESRINASDNS